MELYYQNLISKESSLEQLVDDLMLLVQGAEELAVATGTPLTRERTREIASRLSGLKRACNSIQQQAKASALAFDKVLHQYPYSSVGFGLAAGLILGCLFQRARRS